MHFGENQLSRSLIGLSPLPTPHPLSFQPKWVRASTTSYSRFTLDMGRSLRFGSKTHNSTALFRLAFATAPQHWLTSLHTLTRRLILQKARHHPPRSRNYDQALTDYQHMVSGTISLPSRGTFHHSLTVLFTIGHRKYLGLPDGPGRFTRDSTNPALLENDTKHKKHSLHLRDSHPLRQRFPTSSANHASMFNLRQKITTSSHNPKSATAAALTRTQFSLLRFRSPLLTQSLLVFSSSGY